jgi:hypothetical protein
LVEFSDFLYFRLNFRLKRAEERNKGEHRILIEKNKRILIYLLKSVASEGSREIIRDKIKDSVHKRPADLKWEVWRSFELYRANRKLHWESELESDIRGSTEW